MPRATDCSPYLAMSSFLSLRHITTSSMTMANRYRYSNVMMIIDTSGDGKITVKMTEATSMTNATGMKYSPMLKRASM